MPTIRGTALAFTALSVLIGCTQAPLSPPPAQDRTDPDTGPADKPKFVANPTPTPPPPPGVPSDWPKMMGKGGRYFEDFSGIAASWRDWKDAKKDDGYNQPWLFSGNWYVATAYVAPPSAAQPSRTTDYQRDPFAEMGSSSILPAATARAIEFNDMRPQPALSFRRYAGKAFGTDNGELPANYQVSFQVTPLESRDDFFPPIGDLGTPVYYLDPQHYVEVLIKPDKFEVWECNGGEPLKWRGWRQLYEEAASTSAGVPYSMGATVNSNDGTMQVYFGGQMRREVKSTIIKPYSHYVALRAGSNHVQFTSINIQGM